MEMDVSKNPGLLKLDLYCKGIRIENDAVDSNDGRAIMRTRAGLGSGLEVILPDGLWTNIPVQENFAKSSPYTFHRENGNYLIKLEGREVAKVRLSPKPAWYDRVAVSGKKMRTIGSLQGTYLGMYPSKVCEYWERKPERENCKFCSVGLNLGIDDADEKTIDEILDVVHAALKESGITYVDFNTGHYPGDTYLDILEPFIKRIKQETGLLIGIQTPPHPDLKRYDALKKMGVNRVSFCFEIYDEKKFIEVCPGKHKQYGLKRYLDTVKYCAGLSRSSALFEPWVSNGEIVAGLEPAESSIAAIDWITSVGAIPTVCVFRPLKGTDYEDVPPPKTEDLIPVFRRMYEACMENSLPIGVAPNIKVSLVLLPEEGRYFLDNPNKYWMKEMKLKLMGKVFSYKYYDTLKKKMGKNK